MKYVFVIVALIVLVFSGVFLFKSISPSQTKPTPTPSPTDEPLIQLPLEQQPRVSLKFSTDGHYVTVNISNLVSASLEYNLIYNTVVKGNQMQTGVNASSKLEGQNTYSKEQLLGSESSGHFTYHEKITNAMMELTLRNSSNRSIFKGNYPFTVTPGKSQDLQLQ